MPAVILDRLPLPSLQVYTVGSILMLACSVHYAIQVTSEFGSSKLNFTKPTNDLGYTNNVHYSNGTFGIREDSITYLDMVLQEHAVLNRAIEVMYFMLQEPMGIWTLINMAYCCFILVGKIIQKLVFGDLRVSEQQHIKDKFWNFVFYKFIFIFGVMNVQYMDEVVLWCSWFSVLGFLHLLAQLCKDRCEYLSFSPTTPKWTHCRVLTLLFGILSVSLCLFGLCIFIGFHAGINTFAFMAAECSLVTVRTLYVIVRYAIHLCDVKHKGTWEKRATYVYYSELMFELTALSIDFLHHLHMLLWGNIFLSMASLVIAMQLRCLFYEIRHRIKKYKNYLRIVRHMELNYPMATSEELEKNNDDCAICWDYLDSARKLPCSHIFHNSCLRSWLEQDTSCPTCRKTLSDSVDKDFSIRRSSHSDLLRGLGDDTQVTSVNQPSNHFFHFDGSRYISWLPTLFVEVSHSNNISERQYEAIQRSQLEIMARQVQQMFPHLSLNIIIDDLRATKSVETTVENILDGRLVIPPASECSQAPTFMGLEAGSEICGNPLNYIEDAVFAPEVFTDVVDDSSSRFPNFPSNVAATSSVLGCRFSKSPEERERMLAERKKVLIKAAKKRYLEKCQTSSEESSN